MCPLDKLQGPVRARVEELLTGADKVLQHDDLLISFLSELPTSQALKVDKEGKVVVLFCSTVDFLYEGQDNSCWLIWSAVSDYFLSFFSHIFFLLLSM